MERLLAADAGKAGAGRRRIGAVEAVEPLNSSGGTKFSTGWGTQFGCWFTVDGKRYFGMFEGDLTAGEVVTLRCLPRSRCILYISAKEEQNQ